MVSLLNKQTYLMDDKVLKLIDRAINEGLSYEEVQGIMSFNGYDQSAIEEALSEIKKKRPAEFVSDVQFPSDRTDSTAFDVRSDTANVTQPVSESPSAESDSEDPLAAFKNQYAEDRGGLQKFADDQIQKAQDLNDKFQEADPDPMNFFESAYQRISGIAQMPMNLPLGAQLGNVYEEIERSKQQEEMDQDMEIQASLRDQRILANAQINEHFGFDYNLYEENEQGILVANQEKKKKYQDYLDGLNSQGEYIRSQIAIQDAITKDEAMNKLGTWDKFKLEAIQDLSKRDYTSLVYDFSKALGASVFGEGFEETAETAEAFGTSMDLFGESLVNNMIGTTADLFGADEKVAGRKKQQLEEKRATMKLEAGLDPRDNRTFSEYYADGEIGKGSLSLGLTLAEQAPQFAITVINPALGLSLGAASAGSASYMDVRNRFDMTAGEKVMSTVVSAGAEYLFEKIGMGDVTAVRRALGVEALEAATKVERNAARKEILKTLRKESKYGVYKSIGKQGIEEGFEELGVELTNSVLSYLVTGETPTARDFFESFTVGALMGAGFSGGPALMAKGVNGMATFKQMKEFQAVTDEIMQLQEQLQQNMSPYDRQVKMEKLQELATRQREISQMSMEVYKAMPKEAQAEMLRIQREFSAAYEAYGKSSDSKTKESLMTTMKDLLKDKNLIEQEYMPDAVSAQLFDPTKIKVDDEFNNDYDDSNSFEGKIQEGNGISKTEAKGLNRIFGAIRGKTKVVVHNNLQSLINSNEKARKITKQGKGVSTPGYFEKSTNTIHVLSPSAFRAYNQHRGNKGLNVSDISKVYQHEVIHPILEQIIESDPDTLNRLHKEILDLQGKDATADEAVAFGGKYSQFSEEQQKKEVVTEFLALMSRKINMDRMSRENRGFIQRMKDYFNDMLRTSGSEVQINTDSELMIIAQNLAESFRTGSEVTIEGQETEAPAEPVQETVEGVDLTTAPAMTVDDNNEIQETLFTLITDRYKKGALDTGVMGMLNQLAEGPMRMSYIKAGIDQLELDTIVYVSGIAVDDLQQRTQIRISQEKALKNIRTAEGAVKELLDFQKGVDNYQKRFNEAETEQDEKNVIIDYLAALSSIQEKYLPVLKENQVDSMDIMSASQLRYRTEYINRLQSFLVESESGFPEKAFESLQQMFVLGKRIGDNLLSNSPSGNVLTAKGLYVEFADDIKHQKELLKEAKMFSESGDFLMMEKAGDLTKEIKKLVTAFYDSDFKDYLVKTNFVTDETRSYNAIDFVVDLLETRSRAVMLPSGKPKDYEDNGLLHTVDLEGTPLHPSNFPLLEALASAYELYQGRLYTDAIKDFVTYDSLVYPKEGASFVHAAIITAMDDLGISFAENPWAESTKTNYKALELAKLTPLQPETDILTEKLFLDSPLMKSLDPSTLKMKSATVDQWMKFFGEVKGGAMEAELLGMRSFLEGYLNENPGKKSIPFEPIQEFLYNNVFEVSVNAPRGINRWAQAYYDGNDVILPTTLSDVLTSQYEGTIFYPDFDYPANLAYSNIMTDNLEVDIQNGTVTPDSFITIEYDQELVNIPAQTVLASLSFKQMFGEDVSNHPKLIRDLYDGTVKVMPSESAALSTLLEMGSGNYILGITSPRERYQIAMDHMAESNSFVDDPTSSGKENIDYVRINVGSGLTTREAIAKAMMEDRMYSLGRHTSYSISYGRGSRAAQNYSEILVQHPDIFIDGKGEQQFKNSIHYSDPNVILFTRIAEGTAEDGGRVLIVDELQSDWGQKARAQGMSPNPKTAEIDEDVKFAESVLEIMKNHYDANTPISDYAFNLPLSEVFGRLFKESLYTSRDDQTDKGGGTRSQLIFGSLENAFSTVREYFESAPHHLIYFTGKNRSQSADKILSELFEVTGVDYEALIDDAFDAVVKDKEEFSAMASMLLGEEQGSVEKIKGILKGSIDGLAIEIFETFIGDSLRSSYHHEDWYESFVKPMSVAKNYGGLTFDRSNDEAAAANLALFAEVDYEETQIFLEQIQRAMRANNVDEFNQILAEDNSSNLFFQLGKIRLGISSNQEKNIIFSIKAGVEQNQWGSNPSLYTVYESSVQKILKDFDDAYVNRQTPFIWGGTSLVKELVDTGKKFDNLFPLVSTDNQSILESLEDELVKPNLREEHLDIAKKFLDARIKLSEFLKEKAPKALSSFGSNFSGVNPLRELLQKGKKAIILQTVDNVAQSVNLYDQVIQAVENLHDQLDPLNLSENKPKLKDLYLADNVLPFTPYGYRTEDWAGMGMRVISQLAAKGGFDYAVWLPGYIQTERWGDTHGAGPAKFYDNVLPKIAQKSIKRFDNKSKIKPINVLNNYQDRKAGAFQALGFKVTDKMKKFFEDNNAPMFTLDTDFAADVPVETKESPVTILNALTFADQAGLETNLQFKEELTKRLHEDPKRDQIIEKYGLTLEKGPDGLMHYRMDDNLADYLADAFELETLVAIKAYPDAIGWYDETVNKAMTVVELMYPEIKGDKDLAAIMKMSIAITSNGLKVKQNFALAVKQYEYFRANGKFNPELVEGTQGGAMTTSFTFINKVLESMSIENFVTFLTTPVKNGEMFYYKVGKNGKKSKQNLTPNYPANYELFGAAVFGPKIGNGFFMNLMGEFQTLTIDRWLTRQFGRLRGDLLIGRNLENTKKADKRFKKAVKALGKRDRKKLKFLSNELTDLNVKMTGRDGEIDWNSMASEISTAASKAANLDILQSNPKLIELRKAANGLTKYLAGEKESPSTGRERVFMEGIFKELQNRLFSKYGISITIADLQAVNWYPEKALYQTFQENNSISSAKDFTSEEEKPDYFSGASEVAREKGITQKQIDNAIEKLDFRHESVREAVRKGDGQFGTADQEADLEGIRRAINQVRAGQEVTSTFFHLDDEFTGFTQGSRLGDVKYSSVQPHVKQAKTFLERKMNENPIMELDGPNVIKSPADVAFLLRHMESESSESTYLVVRDMDNPENYEVTYMTTGTVNSASVDNIKIRQITTKFQETNGAETRVGITLVHNHPSGALKESTNDKLMHRKLKEVFKNDPGVTIEDSVIINLDSGDFVTFDDVGIVLTAPVDYNTKTRKVKVQNFNRQELFRPRTVKDAQIRTSASVAKMLSYFKVSGDTKLGVIITSNTLGITRIAVLDAGVSAKDLALMLERTVGKYGNRIAFFGNDKAALKALAVASRRGLEQQNIDLIDAVHIQHSGGYQSASDKGYTIGSATFDTMFTLEEVADEAPEDAMSIEESLQVTEMQAEQSPLYRERDMDLPNIEEINDVIENHKAGKKILDENAPLKDGDLVGGRLNLNLLEAGQKKYGYRMSILSVHKAKNQKATKYQEHNGVSTFAREKVVRNFDVMTLRNAYFNVNVKGSSEVGTMLFNRFVKKMDPKAVKAMYPTAKNKFPLASVDGEYVDTPRENSNFDGILIKYNPMASHMFMDVTGRPIKFAEEVTLMGDRAYARGKIEYAETAWDLHQVPAVDGTSFTIPTKVTTDPDRIQKVHQDMMDNGVMFTIDDSGYESHNVVNNDHIRMRRTASRVAASTQESELRSKILENPENYINPQNLAAIEGKLELMTDAEILEVMTDNAVINISQDPGSSNDNIFVLAAIERINRMQANGEDVSDAIEQLAKVGTTVGRMLRQFAQLKASNPMGIVMMVEAAMGKANRRMTDTQRERLSVLANEFLQDQKALIEHLKQVGMMSLEEFNKKTTELEKKLNQTTRKMNKMIGLLVPKKMFDLFGTLIKGNLMSPVSLATNVTANIVEQMRFVVQRPIQNVIEYLSVLASKVTSKVLGREVGVKEYEGRQAGVTMRGFWFAVSEGFAGTYESLKGMFIKDGETQKIVHTGLQPMYSLFAFASDTKAATMINKILGRDLIPSDVLPRTKDGKIKAGDRVKLLIEGTLGIPADIVFRALAVGDKPFSRFSAAYVVYNEAVKKFGIKARNTEEFKQFLKYPPAEAVRKANLAGQESTFQSDNAAASMILQIKKIGVGKGNLPGKVFGFLMDSFMPYIKTPANIFVDTLKMAIPGLGVSTAMYNYSQGKYKAGSRDLAMATMGAMMVKAADLLIAAGAIFGAFTDEDKEEKSLVYMMTGPNVINRSAIARFVATGFTDTSVLKAQENDQWSKLEKFGILGAVLGARATAAKEVDLSESSDMNTYHFPGEDPMFDVSAWLKFFDGSMVGSTFHFVNQMSFLKGTNSLISILAGEAEGYEMQKNIDGWARSVMSIGIPATLGAIRRAEAEYMTVFRNKDLGRRMVRIFHDKTMNVEGYAPRIDLVGRPILQTPEGKDPYYYHLVSVYKSKMVDKHPVVQEYYRLMMATEDGSWLPSVPSKLSSYYYTPTRSILGDYYDILMEGVEADEKIRIRFKETDLAEMQRLYYTELTKLVSDRMKSDDYKKADDAGKIKMIQEDISYVKKGLYRKGGRSVDMPWLEKFVSLAQRGAVEVYEQRQEALKDETEGN